MTTEDTPLLQNEHDSVYERFSPQKKKVLVAIVSWGGLVACEPYFFTSGRTAAKFPKKIISFHLRNLCSVDTSNGQGTELHGGRYKVYSFFRCLTTSLLLIVL